MILAYNDTDLLIEENEFVSHVVVVENPVFFRQILMELSSQISGLDGKFVLSDGNKNLKIDKTVELIFNPLAIDINSRKVLTKLYDTVEQVANNEFMYAETMNLKTILNMYMQKLICQSDYPLSFCEDFSVKALFSTMNLCFDNMDGSVLERLITYFEVIKQFTDIQLLVFVNLSNYLGRDEMEMLYKEAIKRRIQLVLVEARYEKKINMEKLLIIDKDLCIVRNE